MKKPLVQYYQHGDRVVVFSDNGEGRRASRARPEHIIVLEADLTSHERRQLQCDIADDINLARALAVQPFTGRQTYTNRRDSQ